MSRVALSALLATFIAVSASAMAVEIDTDGDGKASFTEIKLAYPELTGELFAEIDLNSDGVIDDEELMIAIETFSLADPVVDV